MLRYKIRSGVIAASIALFGVPMAAYALVDSPAGAVLDTPASVTIFNQKPKNNKITVSYAFLPSAGQLVIHKSGADGRAEKAAIGSVKLEAGDHRDISVTLNETVPAGTSLWASLTNAEQKPFWTSSLPLANEFRIE